MTNEIFEYYFDKILSIVQLWLYLTIRVYMSQNEWFINIHSYCKTSFINQKIWKLYSFKYIFLINTFSYIYFSC